MGELYTILYLSADFVCSEQPKPLILVVNRPHIEARRCVLQVLNPTPRLTEISNLRESLNALDSKGFSAGLQNFLFYQSR